MIVERQNGEILIRFPAGTRSSKIQSILDYLRYEELTSKSTATEKDLEAKITPFTKEMKWKDFAVDAAKSRREFQISDKCRITMNKKINRFMDLKTCYNC